MIFLPENIADQNDKNECDVTEASDNQLWKDVITAEDGVITAKCAVHTLLLSEHDFFKANSSGKKAVAKVKNVAQKTHKQNISEFSSTTTYLFLDWIVGSVGVPRF